MIELLPKSLLDKFSPPTTSTHDRGQDSSSTGLLSPDGSPRRSHRRQSSRSRLFLRKGLCSTAAIALLAVAVVWLLFIPIPDGRTRRKAEDVTTPVPLGQSVDRYGREYFWWEQFPRLHGLYQGRKTIVPYRSYVPEQYASYSDPVSREKPTLTQAPLPEHSSELQKCYIDAANDISPPVVFGYHGLPQRMSASLFGSLNELGMRQDMCYDRINRLAPYGLGFTEEDGGFGIGRNGDIEGLEQVSRIDWKSVKWHDAQSKCQKSNADKISGRTAFVIRTWHTKEYSPYEITMLRAIISELSLASGGQYDVHFLIHVQDNSIPIWASHEEYERVLKESLPKEFHGMGTLWSVAQMKLIYPPPFPDSIINFSGGDIYEAYRSLHFPLQYFASRHSEYEYFWQWEMDMRVTGHYLELVQQITTWAESQSRDYLWERSSKFFIPSLHKSYSDFAKAVVQELHTEGRTPVSGPQLPADQLLPIPSQPVPATTNEITDLITLNPLFDPSQTRWAFRDDITGYNGEARPPTRAALITASRMSRRLLLLMHEETYRHKRTMFPEMYPASVALHYGLKAVYAPLPVYMDRDWPAEHADVIFNNAKLDEESIKVGMDHGGGFFHGENGSVFGPGEHVFRGASYYSNAAFAGYLWRRWLGNENGNNEVAWESEGGDGGGRMCLPMMVLHPVKHD